MADLFVQMDQLFRGQTPEGKVPVYVLHRFLASDRNFAQVAKDLAPIWDDEMVVEIWRSCLPRMRNAPRLKYVAPKKPPAMEALAARLAREEAWTQREAEEVVELLALMKLTPSALRYYGIEDPKKEKKS